MLPDNFVQIFTNALTSADQSCLEKHFTTILSPVNFNQIASQMEHSAIVFILCLALKDKIRTNNHHSFLIDPIQMKERQKMNVFEDTQKIAGFNPILTHLCQSQDNFQDCHHKSSDYKKTFVAHNQILEMIRDSPEEFKKRLEWYEYINYLELLLTSLSNYELITLEHKNQSWTEGALKLREQMIGKLIIESLIRIESTIQDNYNFQILIRYTVSRLPQNDRALSTLINIIFESVYYLGNELNSLDQMRTRGQFGQSMFALMLGYFEEFTLRSQDLTSVSTLIETIHLFLKISFYEEESSNIHQQDLEEHEGQTFGSEWRVPEWLEKYSIKLLTNVHNCLRKISQLKNVVNLKIKILEILRLVAGGSLKMTHYSGGQLKARAKGEINSRMRMMFKTLRVLAEQSTIKLKQNSASVNRQLIFYEYELTNTIHRFITCFKDFSLGQGNDLVQFTFRDYWRVIIEKLPLSIECGQNHPLPIIASTLSSFIPLLKKYPRLGQVVNERVYQLNSQLLFQHFREEFATFDEETEATSSFMKPIAHLYFKMTFFNHFINGYTALEVIRMQFEAVLGDSRHRGQYMLRLCLQMLRSINKPSIQRSSNKYDVFWIGEMIITNFSDRHYSREFIMLYDIVLELMLPQHSSTLDSYFCSRVKGSSSPNDFVNNIVLRLVKSLLQDSQRYDSDYIIHILCRTFRRFKAAEISSLEDGLVYTPNLLNSPDERKVNIINAYFDSAFNFPQLFDHQLIRKIKSYKSRKNLLELMVSLVVSNFNKLENVCDNFLGSRVYFRNQEDIINFIIDITGLLSAQILIRHKALLFQLVVLKIKEYQNILSIFSESYLSSHNEEFDVFVSFIKIYFENWMQLKDEVYHQIPLIHNLLKDKFQLFCKLYNSSTIKPITELYLILVDIPTLYDLPQLPHKIYFTNDGYSCQLIHKYLKSLNRLSSRQDLITLYQNIFERKTMAWTFEERAEGLNEEIISTVGKPDVLLTICDYLETLQPLDLSLDHKSLIRSIFCDIYTLFVEKFSSSSDSFDESFDKVNVNYVEEFYLNITQKNLNVKLSQAQYSFDYIQSGILPDYQHFQYRFFSETRKILESVRTPVK